MKLAAKLILIFLLGVFAIVSLFAWQTIRRQHAWEAQRRSAHAGDIAATLAPTIQQAYETGGTITIQQAVEVSTRQLNGPEVHWMNDQENIPHQTETTSRQSASISITDAKGNRKAYSYVPINLDDETSGTVVVSEALNEQDDFMRGSVLTSMFSLLVVAVFSGVVIFFGGVQLVGKPLNRLIAQVNQIGDGQLDQPPVLESRDEFGRLASAISEMSHRISQQRDTIRHTDRLGTIGTLAAGMAHELGTPLNVVSGRAGLIKSGKLSAEEVVASAETIQSEAERMTKIIRQLLDFARQKPSTHALIGLNDVVERTCELMRPLAAKSNVDIIADLPNETIQIDGDASQIQQVLTNLITNAIAAISDSGSVTVSLADLPDQRCQIEVSDTGTGIDTADMNHVFEPFYTTKDVGEGTGLGLSIAYGIVREHGGNLRVQSSPSDGTTFTISFPSQTCQS